MPSRKLIVLKYSIATFGLFWFIVAKLSVLLFVYENTALRVDPGLPTVTYLQLPLIGLALTGVVLAVAYVFFDGFIDMTRRIIRWGDEALGWNVLRDRIIEGRLVYDGLSWRLAKFSDGSIEVIARECPLCGNELVEKILPEEEVYGPNSATNPPRQTRESSNERWRNITSAEKSTKTVEIEALACPDCNFSVPGRADVIEGRDEVISKFRNHLREMKRPNSRLDPYGSFRKAAEHRLGRPPDPGDLWDQYVRETEPDDGSFVYGLNMETPTWERSIP